MFNGEADLETVFFGKNGVLNGGLFGEESLKLDEWQRATIETSEGTEGMKLNAMPRQNPSKESPSYKYKYQTVTLRKVNNKEIKIKGWEMQSGIYIDDSSPRLHFRPPSILSFGMRFTRCRKQLHLCAFGRLGISIVEVQPRDESRVVCLSEEAGGLSPQSSGTRHMTANGESIEMEIWYCCLLGDVK